MEAKAAEVTPVDDLLVAEQKVLHQTNTLKVLVCGKERELKPLPIKPSKKLGGILNVIVQELNKVGKMSEEEREKSVMGGKEDAVADAYVKALALLSDVYGWNNTADEIESQMTMKEVRAAVDAQVKLNEDDDFLLLAPRLISQILSQTGVAATKALEGLKALSSSASQSSSESLH